MKPILVIEQDPQLEGSGLLGERLAALELPFRSLQVWKEELADVRVRDYSGIAPLGGNAHAWSEAEYPFLVEERRLLGEAVAEGLPVLAICLGAQVLARALGAEVGPVVAPEVGWLSVEPTVAAADDPLFAHVDGAVGVFQWHQDGFELPEDAVRLASSAQHPNQAFRVRNAWGVQFHPEVEYATFAGWIANAPGSSEAYGIDEAVLHEDVRRGAAETKAWRSRLFDAFGELCAVGSEV
jgi:GMP synthase-like glutamine amidotransferase